MLAPRLRARFIASPVPVRGISQRTVDEAKAITQNSFSYFKVLAPLALALVALPFVPDKPIASLLGGGEKATPAAPGAGAGSGARAGASSAVGNETISTTRVTKS